MAVCDPQPNPTKSSIATAKLTLTPSHVKVAGGQFRGIDFVSGPPAPIPDTIEGIPLGLEYFYGLRSLVVCQERIANEIALPLQLENQYTVFNSDGMRIFCAGEVETVFSRTCFGRHRPFLIQLLDCHGRLLMEAERRCSCLLCYFGAGVYGGNVSVFLRTSNVLLGRIVQNCSCITPAYSIINPDGNKPLEIKGKDCISCWGCCMVTDDSEFKVLSRPDMKIVGGISKAIPGKTQPNDFSLWMEENLDVQLKALMLAALVTIKISYFDNKEEMCPKCWCCRCMECTGVKATVWILAFLLVFLIFTISLKANGAF